MKDDLINTKSCKNCKLFKVKCEGAYALKGIEICGCKYFVSDRIVKDLPDTAKSPYPIVEKKVRKSK